ncbi:hypothetical protein [Pseudopedobacter beijingensis]|uniref:Uncharacterized protein n=1 Tax=Pseudopedobacter beijingensis TaxID=1207056 RepID=A0ABW4I9P0_9SPHI
MRIYTCNQDLIMVLENQGFVDVTPKRDKQRGKRKFSLSKTSRSYIYFNYKNFEFFEGKGCNCFSGSQVVEEELKLLFWYLKSSTADKKAISNGCFHLKTAKANLGYFVNELSFYKENGFVNRSIPKLERLVYSFNSLQI